MRSRFFQTRLIAAGYLKKLVVNNSDRYMNIGPPLFDAHHESTGAFCAAVRASRLTTLVLGRVGRVPRDVAAVAEEVGDRPRG